jgi:hypothetical protein
VGRQLKKIANVQMMIVRLVVPKYKTKIKKPKIKPKEKKVELNNIGYPVDDPYGLVAAFWTIFTKPTEDKKNG